MFYERSITSTGACRLCGQPRTEQGEEAHAAMHLARCEAVTITENGITKVVPTTDVPWNPKDGPAPDGKTALPVLGQRKPDAKLVALARAALKKAHMKGTKS